jgi:GH35 family endo-1,4-beta-xylanase
VKFQVGRNAGVIELRYIRLEDMGEDPRMVAAKAALTPEKIAARIREHRMAELQVEVRDTAGRPVPEAGVHIEQQRHAFLFGCNIFELRPGDSAPLQKAYQEKFVALLNYATLPFYWGTFEPQRDQPQHERLEKMARWCQQRGIACKGHPLVWHEVWPRWAPAEAGASLPLLRARVFDIIPRYRETIRYWDVFNEANSASHFAQTGVGQWIKRDGPATAVAVALGWARAANRQSGATLLYNDFKVNAENVDLLYGLRERNALPDAIGLQSHMHAGPWPLPRAWDVMERFAIFGRPLHFTELTVVSGPEPRHAPGLKRIAGWDTTPAGEAAQARYVAELYTILFSHPAMRAITWWDFSDYHAWKGAPAGLLRKDMSPKPVYDELYKLIRETWWTRATAKTGVGGATTVRVFRGLHTITATDAAGHTASQTVEIPAEGAAPKVTVTLP